MQDPIYYEDEDLYYFESCIPYAPAFAPSWVVVRRPFLFRHHFRPSFHGGMRHANKPHNPRHPNKDWGDKTPERSRPDRPEVVTRTPVVVPAPVPIPGYRQRAQLRKAAAAQQFPKATQPVVRPRTAQRPNNLVAQRQQQRYRAMKGQRDAQEPAQQMEPQRE